MTRQFGVATTTTALLLLAGAASNANAAKAEQEWSDYGVDCSFPIHSKESKCGNQLGDKKKFYEDFMQGCRDFVGPKKAKACDRTEDDRIEMSLLQPRSMVNFTSTGFKKMRAPEEAFELITQHWETNKNARTKEQWSTGNIYVNHWESPTYMVSVEDTGLRGAGISLKNKIWDAVKPEIEKWTGMELKPVSQYGIRIYTEGAVLSPHVDRMPLISSCIINVDQDLDEPWPLEVIDRKGMAVNVTMRPGDMVLYESGSLIHARPFPMKGRHFANIFIHFEPTGRKLGDTTNEYLDDLDDFYPPYLQADSPWAERWARQNPNGWKKPAPSAPQLHSTVREPHVAASMGDVDRLQELLAASQDGKKSVHRPDENGWHPLHEAVRSGHTAAAKLLVENGADVNVRTGRTGQGQSPLSLALEYHTPKSSIVQYLTGLGAREIDTEEL